MLNKCDCGGSKAEGLHAHWCDTNKPYRHIGIDWGFYDTAIVWHNSKYDAELTLRLIKALDHIPFDAKLIKD